MSTTSALHTSASLKAANAPMFSSLQGKLDSGLLQGLKSMEFEYMTPVQQQVLSSLPTMDSDCLVQAKTGTGKTTAFLLPAIQNSLYQPSLMKGHVAILVLSPTRELALQIAAEAERLVSKLIRPLQVHTAFGGTARASSLQKFRRGDPKILVATPGRLNDYLAEIDVRTKFQGMRTLILDEADRMLDAGFLPDILRILKALPPKASAGGHWQGMCFSATIPPKMGQVLSHVLKKDHSVVSTIDASEPPTLARVPQFSLIIPRVEQTFTALFSVLKAEIKATDGKPKIIVFGSTANLVALYAKVYENQLEMPVFELHSRLSQPARTKTTDNFKKTDRGIMFASDVIGRGMDFPNVTLVLQVGLPADADSYTHRVGRTARAGKDGRALLLLTRAEEFYLRVNPQFPIKPYPNSTILMDDPSAAAITVALHAIDPKAKQKAYSAYLGFMKGFLNKMRMTADQLVAMANDLALKGMLCDDIPEMEKRTIGKMGLKGVRGIRYASVEVGGHPGPKRSDANTNHKQEITRRMNHQDMPEPTVNSMFHSSNTSETRRSNGARGRGSANHARPIPGGPKLHPPAMARNRVDL